MLSIQIPKKISVKVAKNWISIEGPLGKKIKKKSEDFEIFLDLEKRTLNLFGKNLKQNHFYLALINRMILGVLTGFSMKLNLIGIGYKLSLEKNFLVLKIGYSHSVHYKIPSDIQLKILNQKFLTLIISGNDFQKVTQVAAEIRALKPPEPYKGKGFRYPEENVRKKEGKKANV